MMKTKYIICNLKANKTLEEILLYKKVIDKIEIKDNKLIICPPCSYISLFNNINYDIGSQDVSMFIEGSFTGEVCARQLASLNVKYSLIGHYERRKYLKEDNNCLVKKINNCLNENIGPILFIGEPESLLSDDYLMNQIKEVFDEINFERIKDLIIVYEPAQSIGTRTILDVNIIKNKIIFIKKYIKDNYNENIPVMYGGSVTEENVLKLVSIKELDGVILGHSSLNPYTVNKIYNNF